LNHTGKFWTQFPTASDDSQYKDSQNRRNKQGNRPTQTHTTPLLSAVTWNARGFSEYYTNEVGAIRCKNKHSRVKNLAGEKQALFFQETHFHKNEENALRSLLPGWGIYYSNKNSQSAGVVTALPPRYMHNYTVVEQAIPHKHRGHLVILRLVPRKTDDPLYSKSIMFINVYLYTGPDRQARQLNS